MAITAKVIILVAAIAGVSSVNLIIKNNEIGPIWIGILGDPDQSTPSKGGVVVESFTNVSEKISFSYKYP